MLSELDKYGILDREGVIDKRFPCWWELGFEGRHYVEPEEFFGGLEEFEGRKVQLGPDDKDIRFTIINQKVNRLGLPLFVTSKPLDKLNQNFVAKYGWEEMLHLVAESLPHVRGIAVSLDEESLFWYPTANGLATKMEYMGNKLRDHSFSVTPARFFSRLISCHMIPSKGTYYNVSYKGGNWRVPKLDFVPFYEFSGREGEGMVVPSKSRAKLMLPTLVMGRGAGIPLIRGFTNSEILYKIHKNSAHIARRYIEERSGLDCEVYR